ncbi:MAG: hypothetical protein ACHQUC_05575 [Chlamydiales bacterium]
MTAGYLSNEALVDAEKKESVIAFFRNLIAAPNDLAINCELCLLAQCFAETSGLEETTEYSAFVNNCLSHIKDRKNNPCRFFSPGRKKATRVGFIPN